MLARPRALAVASLALATAAVPATSAQAASHASHKAKHTKVVVLHPHRHGRHVVVYRTRFLRGKKLRHAAMVKHRWHRTYSIGRLRAATRAGKLRVTVRSVRSAPTLRVQVVASRVHRPNHPSTTTTPTPTPAPTPTTDASTNCTLGQFSASHMPGACWRPYSDSSPFNRAVPSGAKLVDNSSAMVSRMLGFGPMNDMDEHVANGDSGGRPTYYSSPTDPVFTLHCTEAWGHARSRG